MPSHDDSDRLRRQQQLLDLLRQLSDRIHAGASNPWSGDESRSFDDYCRQHTLDEHERIVAEARQSSLFDQPGDE